MRAISIAEVLTAVNGQLLGDFRQVEAQITSVETDSRKVGPDSLFIPLVGDRFDGHAFLRQALESGAAACLTAKEPDSLVPGKCYIKVESTLKALGDLARYYKEQFPIPFIAVTGSVGKTTTKDMVSAVLGEKFNVLKTEGNFNNDIGLPLTLLRLEESHQIAVVEMGMNHFGEIDYLASILHPDVAVITNIGDAHIENMGSREGTLKAKSEVFAHMSENGFAVLNGDDELLSTLRGTLPCPAVWVGGNNGLEYRALSVETDGEQYVHCDIATPQGEYPVDIPALGGHMIYPMLTAVAIGEHFGMTREEIARGVLRFAPTKMRMNILTRGNGITILDDAYNANPQSMRAAAEVLAKTKSAKKVAVLGDMFELGPLAPTLHAGVGESLAACGIDALVAVGENAEHMARAAEAAGLGEVYWRPTKKEALTVLEQIVSPDTTFLVKASRGMEFEELVAYLKSVTTEP